MKDQFKLIPRDEVERVKKFMEKRIMDMLGHTYVM